MSLAASQAQFLKGATAAAAQSSKNDSASTHKTAATTVVARANRGSKSFGREGRTDGKTDKRRSGDGSEAAAGQSLPRQLLSGIAAASILANVALVPVALAQVYAEQVQLEGNPTEVRDREERN